MPTVHIRNVKLILYSSDEEEAAVVKLQRMRRSESKRLSKSQRPIAGSRRVARFRMLQGLEVPPGRVLLQSITATPAYGGQSFEELRMQAYSEAYLAKGHPPCPVDLVETPWSVIPPLFNVFCDTNADDGLSVPDIEMS